MGQEDIKELRDRKEKIEAGGGKKRVDKQHKKGKYTARERIEKLLDNNSFVEMDAFVEHRCTNFGMEDRYVPGEGVVTGYGTIEDRLVFVFAQDFTSLGGSLGEMHAKKINKVQKMAIEKGAPLIGINDSGGARIQEGVDALSGYGKIFQKNVIASGVIPQFSLIMGPCAGGAVYSPALTDFIFMVDQTSKMFITGPSVIKTVTGEEVSAEKLGGAMTHNKISGVADFATSDEDQCFERLRKLFSYLPSNNLEDAPMLENDNLNQVIEDLEEIVPDNPNKAYNMLDLIEKIVDQGDFFEVKPYYAKNIIIGFARLGGRSVGIIANQPNHLAGCLNIKASNKASRFIRFCDSFNIPVVNLIDVPGFLPGVDQEYNGIIKDGAKMLYAYSEATVPKISIIIRKAYGGSYLAMCSKELGADQVLAWPSSEIAVMGPEGAANVVFRKEIKKSDNPQEKRQEKIDDYRESFANPYVAASRGYIDDVIEPADTRKRIISALEMTSSKRENRPAKKHGNIPL